jgi:hypothetical protein
MSGPERHERRLVPIGATGRPTGAARRTTPSRGSQSLPQTSASRDATQGASRVTPRGTQGSRFKRAGSLSVALSRFQPVQASTQLGMKENDHEHTGNGNGS